MEIIHMSPSIHQEEGEGGRERGRIEDMLKGRRVWRREDEGNKK